MPKKPQMTLRSGKALANAAPILPQSRSDRRSQTLMLDDEEEEPLVRKRLRRSYQQTSSSAVSDHHGNNDDRQKELSLPAATLPSASTASRNASPTSAQNAMALTFLMSPPSSIQQNQQSSYRLQPPTLHPPLSQISANTPIARIVASTGQWKTLAPKQDVKGKGTKQTDVKGDRQQLTRFWRRPEINALVDWVLTPGNHESLRVENAKKAGRTVNDVYGDVARYVRERVGWTKTGDEGNYDAATARKDVDYIKKKFSATYSRVFNMTGNGTTDDATTVPQRVHQECPNFYEMLSIFRPPSLSKPINTTTAHSTGPTAIAKAGEAEIIDTELSDDEPSKSTQNLISVMGNLTQVLGSLSGNGTGASSSGRDYFINRIEQLERKLEQQNELITQQKDIICGLQIKLARAGILF
ncbi:hypothetical protein BGZ89_009630 [Linnemannia elongata]|nr:hypothetical protein BGZ89_009630 [Linnemannia elongata]